MIPRILLAGLMGAGKSTVGRELARRLGVDYVDNDEEFARLAGESTADFAAHGPEALHAVETEYVHGLLARPAPFVAGLPAYVASERTLADEVSAAGFVVYLQATPATLLARTAAAGRRPWLSDDAGLTLQQMFDERNEAFIAMADLVIAVDAESLEAIADRIITRIPKV